MLRTETLNDRRALVTGGGRGIGRAIAAALGAAGAQLVLCGRTQASLDEAQAALQEVGCSVQVFPCDVSDEDQVVHMFACLTASAPLDILINNAGIGAFKPLIDTTLDDWEDVCATNLRGSFLCAREAMRVMATGGGRIINIGSVVSVKGYRNQAAYTASKHGLLGLTKVMALEGQAANIIVQAVLPGGVDTDLVAAARPDLARDQLMRPEDVAAAVLFLLSQDGNAITDVIRLRRRSSPPFA